MPKTRKPRPNPYQAVTDRIIAALEKGCGPWHRPWASAGGFLNASTGKAYRGVNVLLLMMAMDEGEFTHPLFVTFKQAKALGGSVSKGAKGTQLCFFKWLEKDSDKPSPNDGATVRIPLLRFFTVFNVAQTDLDASAYEALLPKPRSIERSAELEAFLNSSGARITFGGDRACYSPFTDSITLPPVPFFDDAGAYYATAFHELVHWTGHVSRLDRQLANRFGSEAYAAEELIAELGSAFLCARFGVEGTLQHPEYIANWLTVLKGDNRAIFTAASQAQKACDSLTPVEEAALSEAAA